MLSSLAEETDSIDRGRRQSLVPLMHLRLSEVLHVCQALLGQALAAGCSTAGERDMFLDQAMFTVHAVCPT